MKWTRKTTIGEGGFATVSMAKVHQTKNPKSSKLPSIIAVKSAKVLKSSSLSNEKKILMKLKRCSYIVRCFGADITKEDGDETYYNVLLEYASGGSLADLISKRGKGLHESIVKIHTMNILLGLSYMHNNGYVHCDIKPGNILLFGGDGDCSKSSRKGFVETAKIGDFGLAKRSSQKLKKEDDQGLFRGTPMYAAPESVANDEFETPCDIWALGCTVLEMITGKTPWERSREGDDDCWGVMYTLGFTDELPEIPSWVSEQTKDFLSKCLVRDVESRWSADMLLAHPFILSIYFGPEDVILNDLSELKL